MKYMAASWRNISFLLALALAITGFNLYIRTGYPTEWDRVRYGMHAAEVWSLCGKPNTSSGGMSPDYWESALFPGRWEFLVNCGDVDGGRPFVVTDISLCYESVLTGRVPIKGYSPELYIIDAQAFAAAFGFHDNATATPRTKGDHPQ